jgi:HlyD family secretion protein
VTVQASHKRLLTWVPIVAIVVVGLVWAFAPRAVVVDLLAVAKGPMAVTVDEEGVTRVHDVFGLSAPVAGRVQRIEAHVGDPVVANETVLARIEPMDPAFLDPRSETQARAAVHGAESALELARAEVEEARAEAEFAETQYRRARELLNSGTISQRDADDAERARRATMAALATTEAALQVRTFELEQARAQLLTPAKSRGRRDGQGWISLRAPRSGRVLRVVNDSERVVAAGDLLVEIGDPAELEIVVDFLSTDAVQIEAGQRVLIERWGPEQVLEGRVRRIEPYGFTKVSALGIEEQRVNVIIDLTSPREQWERLGHGYQVEARVVLWQADDVVTVPLTALFREGDAWAVFVEEHGRAALRRIEVGHRNAVDAEIGEGLEADERVVLHPSDRVRDGVRIAPR